MLTRRDFGKLALAGLPGATMIGGREALVAAWVQGKPSSLIEGVQIGTITYSYRSMTDQSAEATLKYVLDSGISAIELMGGPVESFAGAPASGRGGGGGGGGRGRAMDGDAKGPRLRRHRAMHRWDRGTDSRASSPVPRDARGRSRCGRRR